MSQQILLAIIVLGLLIWQGYRQLRTQRINPLRLWAIPAAMLVLSLVLLSNANLSGVEQWETLGVSVVIGAAAGVLRGLICRVSLDRASGDLLVQGSVWSLLVWFAMIPVRVGARFLVLGGVGTTSTALITPLLLATMGASLLACGVCWYLKAQARRAVSAPEEN